MVKSADDASQERLDDDPYQYDENIVWCFSFHIYSIHLDDFVADMNQTGSISSAAMHDARNYYLSSFLIGFDSGTLQIVYE